MIAVDQDPLGVQCRRVKTNGAEDVLIKPLVNDEFAMCFFNKASSSSVMSYSVKEALGQTFISTPLAEEYDVIDLWSGEKTACADIITADVPAHGVRVFKVRVK